MLRENTCCTTSLTFIHAILLRVIIFVANFAGLLPCVASVFSLVINVGMFADIIEKLTVEDVMVAPLLILEEGLKLPHLGSK